MKRLVLTVAAAALLAIGAPFHGNAVGRFDSRLSKDQQILQALNRLTLARHQERADMRSYVAIVFPRPNFVLGGCR